MSQYINHECVPVPWEQPYANVPSLRPEPSPVSPEDAPRASPQRPPCQAELSPATRGKAPAPTHTHLNSRPRARPVLAGQALQRNPVCAFPWNRIRRRRPGR